MIKRVISPDGVEINYDISKHTSSNNVLLFLHGLGGDLTAMEPLRSFFEKEGFATIAIDLRGHGKSGHPENGNAYKLENLVGDVMHVITEEKLNNLVLIGHCFGGMVSIGVTEKMQEKIKQLVLIDTNYKAPFFAEVINNVFPLRHIIYGIASLLPNIYNKSSVDYKKYVGSADYSIPRIISDVTHTSVRSYTFLSKIILDLDLTSVLDKISVPTLIIEGEKDIVYPPKVAEQLHKRIKNSKLKYIANANHILVITNPKEVFEVIYTYLKTSSEFLTTSYDAATI